MKILNFDSTIATVSAGTAAAPSISFANDPNTGIYSPGADQVAISTGGTGRLFVDSVGNIGVNVSPFAYAANARNLQVNATEYSALTFGTTGGGTGEKYWRWIARTASPAKSLVLQTLDDAGSGEITAYTIIRNGTAIDYQAWNTGGFERLRITSAGNVGIGTAGPNVALDVVGGIRGQALDATGTAALYSSAGGGVLYHLGAGTAVLRAYSNASGAAGNLIFNASGSENARLDSSGRLLVGTSTSTASSGQTAQLQVAGSARITNGLASSIDVGTITQNATSAITLPRSGIYCIYVDQMNLFALFVATISGGSPGVRLIYSTATDVVAGLTAEPAGGTYLRLWISSSQLQVKNVNVFTGPYYITALATSGLI